MTGETGAIDRGAVDAVVCDFDGVLTDNSVYVSEDGSESVRCSRSDGLAFDVLRKINIPSVILSTERNPIVAARAAKLQVPVVHGVGRKDDELRRLAAAERWNLDRVVYIGNDLNDLQALALCGYRGCPADAHLAVAKQCTFQLASRGGDGVVREFVEYVMGVDVAAILYPDGKP